ncbi:hypothetical protein DES44_1243 [Roseateles depolymerans]|uniref:Uncharacterized protein n=2 Tax=Roseateles depolymerans TaxID=76731 RepID=A0A0U3MG09_9BURK|nr:Conserved hypothetical protein, galactose oxidase domain [Roseateles depolymerans]REG22100.1 hypothetical protein DES44_1243 [Roseateles depolymerans]
MFDEGSVDSGKRAFGSIRFGEAANLHARKYSGFAFPIIGVAPNLGKTAFMLGQVSGVAVTGDAGDGILPNIPESAEGPLSTGPDAAATIDGKLYVCAGWRHVCYLDDDQRWVSIRNNLTDPPKNRVMDFGFSAISGFHANDIYAAGGRGDVWRFDGDRWHQCQTSTNMLIESICCAGDGFVYIGLQSGGLMRGREDEWEVIHQDNMSVPFKDIVWYQDKVWCTSEYGLWTVAKDGKLVDADVPPLASACAGNLSTADGILMVAGLHGAALHDGNEWHRLV